MYFTATTIPGASRYALQIKLTQHSAPQYVPNIHYINNVLIPRIKRTVHLAVGVGVMLVLRMLLIVDSLISLSDKQPSTSAMLPQGLRRFVLLSSIY